MPHGTLPERRVSAARRCHGRNVDVEVCMVTSRHDAEALAGRWNLVLPVDIDVQDRARPAARLGSLQGRVVGLLNNSKGNADHLLERIAVHLSGEHGVRDFVRLTKPIFSRPAPEAQLEQLHLCDAVITAIAD